MFGYFSVCRGERNNLDLKVLFLQKKLKNYKLNIINFGAAVVKNLLTLTFFKQNKRNVNFINILLERQIIRLPTRKIAKTLANKMQS